MTLPEGLDNASFPKAFQVLDNLPGWTFTDSTGTDAEVTYQVEDPQDWADRVRADWRRSVSGILAAAADLRDARDRLPHGEWGRMFRNHRDPVVRPVPFTDRTGRLLVAVAENRFLADRNHGSDLPPSWRTLAVLAKLPPEYLEEVHRAGQVHPEMERSDAERLVHEYLEAQPRTDPMPVLRAAPSDLVTDRLTLLLGDFRERLADLPDGSVDLVLSDPPYPREDLGLWSDLAELAARVLADTGILVAWTGRADLPEVLRRLGEHLEYRWCYAIRYAESQARMWTWPVRQAWKPLLVYQKPGGVRPHCERHPDFLEAGRRDKSLYKWQQSPEPAGQLIGLLTRPDAVVLDPMLGVGTFGVPALELGRRFIGVELDPGRFQTSVDRLTNPDRPDRQAERATING